MIPKVLTMHGACLDVCVMGGPRRKRQKTCFELHSLIVWLMQDNEYEVYEFLHPFKEMYA